MSQPTSDVFNVEFTLDSKDSEIIKCKRNEKLINIFKDYAKKKRLNFNSIYFLCNGNKIDDFEQTFDQLANRENKEIMEIKILVFKAGEENLEAINVFFLEIFNTKKYVCDPDTKIKEICDKYEKESNFRPNSMIYICEGKELDLNKTFADYANSKNDIFIKVVPKELVYIIFAYLGTLYSIECFKEDKIEDICADFASKNNINKNKVIFKYQDNLVNQNQTLKEFLQEKNIIINDIKIDVIDSPSPSCFTVHLIKIIVTLIITAAAVGAAVFVYIKFKEDEDKDDQTDNIEPDSNEESVYFIKAIYLIKNSKETIKLISDNFNIKKIKNIKIDGSEKNPTRTYTFNKKGEHNVYYSFNEFNKDSLLSNGNGIFNGIENIISAEFTGYNEYYPDVSFKEMFRNCFNLKSVDLSKIKLDYIPGSTYKKGKYYSSEYFNSINYMFYKCSSLTNVYFPSSNFYPEDMSYSFAFCSSLIFTNCTITIYAKKMNNMFYDCSSLQIFNVTLFDSNNKNINNGAINASNLIDISNMFSGCSSLISIDLSWIATPNVRNYEGLFYDCSSLKDINIVTFTHNDLSDDKLSIFNDNIPSDTKIYMEEKFYDRIEDLIPEKILDNIEIIELNWY